MDCEFWLNLSCKFSISDVNCLFSYHASDQNERFEPLKGNTAYPLAFASVGDDIARRSVISHQRCYDWKFFVARWTCSLSLESASGESATNGPERGGSSENRGRQKIFHFRRPNCQKARCFHL